MWMNWSVHKARALPVAYLLLGLTLAACGGGSGGGSGDASTGVDGGANGSSAGSGSIHGTPPVTPPAAQAGDIASKLALPSGVQLNYIALDSSGKYLYAAEDSKRLVSFAVNQRGDLSQVDSVSFGADFAWFQDCNYMINGDGARMLTEPEKRLASTCFLIGTSGPAENNLYLLAGKAVERFQLADGHFAQSETTLPADNGSTNGNWIESIMLSGNGGTLYMIAGTYIWSCTLSASGALEPTSCKIDTDLGLPANAPADTELRSALIDPAGGIAYAIANTKYSGFVCKYKLGKWSVSHQEPTKPLMVVSLGESTFAYDIAMDSAGKYLYVLDATPINNNNIRSQGAHLVSFAVDNDDLRLAATSANLPVKGSLVYRGMTLDSSERAIYVSVSVITGSDVIRYPIDNGTFGASQMAVSSHDFASLRQGITAAIPSPDNKYIYVGISEVSAGTGLGNLIYKFANPAQ